MSLLAPPQNSWLTNDFRFCSHLLVDCVWNVMAQAQKPDFVFRRNGRVHLNRRGRQFSRLLAAEVCASAVIMLDTPCSQVVWRVLASHCIRQFPLHVPSLRHRVPSRLNWTLAFIAAVMTHGCFWRSQDKKGASRKPEDNKCCLCRNDFLPNNGKGSVLSKPTCQTFQWKHCKESTEINRQISSN